MSKVVFIHGAGDGSYAADAVLAESLRTALGSDYPVVYPAIPDEGNAPYQVWKQCLEDELAAIPEEQIILVGHSVGSSVLLKYMSEAKVRQRIAGLFLLAGPFWGGDGWRYEGYKDLELPGDLASQLPKDTPVYLYHCQDDEVVPFEHLALYRKLLPHAVSRSIATGGHQFDNDLTGVAQDIKKL